MYERFTDRARKVMHLANQEAQQLCHEYIGTEHILLGLLQEGSGIATQVLQNLDIDLHRVRREVMRIVQRGPDMVTLGKLPPTPRAKKVVEYAIDEARQLNHDHVGTEHVLLGLIREQEGVAAQVLMNLGLSLAALRREILQLLGHNVDQPRVAYEPRTSADRSPPGARAVVLLDYLIEAFEEIKEAAIAAQDFPWAVDLRDETDKLRKMKELLLREGPRHANLPPNPDRS
jgi:ATP-dependent Clp protease ATP-binding subunit ClpC